MSSAILCNAGPRFFDDESKVRGADAGWSNGVVENKGGAQWHVPASPGERDTLFHSVLTRERDGKHGKIYGFGRP